MPGQVLPLVRANSAFRSLLCARTVSFAGDSISLVALMLFVADSTGEAVAVAMLLLVGDCVPGLFAPVAGAISDRFDLRRVMVGCEVVQGALLLLIALWQPPLPLLLPLVAARAVAGHVFLPASRSAVPAVVGAGDLPVANSALGFSSNGAEAVGPFIAAALLPLVGIRGVLLIDALSFAVSAVVLARLRPIPRAGRSGRMRSSLLADARGGLAYIWRTPRVRTVVAGFCLVVAFNGVDDVALVILATDTFAAGDSAVALLLGAVGIGLLAGYAVLAAFGARASMPLLLIAGFAVSSLGNLLTGLTWAVAAAFALQSVRGLGLAAMDVATNTIIPRTVPPTMTGRVFGNLYGAVGIAAGLSYVAGGFLLDATSAPTTFLVAGAGGTLVTAVVAVNLWRQSRS